MFRSVKEEFDQCHDKLKMIKQEVSSEIKQETEMSMKDLVELKRENSEKCGLADLNFGTATEPEFVTSTPKDTLGFQKNVKWDLDEQIRPFVEDKSFEGVPKGVSV